MVYKIEGEYFELYKFIQEVFNIQSQRILEYLNDIIKTERVSIFIYSLQPFNTPIGKFSLKNIKHFPFLLNKIFLFSI